MIAQIQPKFIKAGCEFVSAGIGADLNSTWCRLQSNKETGSLFLRVAGNTVYQACIPAKVIRDGLVFVHGKVLVELIGKLKNEFLKMPMNLVEQNQQLVITNGANNGYQYELPVSLIEQAGDFYGPELAAFKLTAGQLLEVIAGMKAIKEAESDTDLPTCEVFQFGMEGRLQFVGITRLRSISSWVDADCLQQYPNGAAHFHLAIEDLVKMEKALKLVVKDAGKEGAVEVEIKVWSNNVEFGFGSNLIHSCRVGLRRVLKDRSNINNLIGICRRTENIKAKAVLPGDKFKQAFDRLDAFGKRNDSSHHRVDFELTSSELKMVAFGQGVGYGREVIEVEAKNYTKDSVIRFAAAGNKLSEILRISKYGKVDLVLGNRNILIEWRGEEAGIEHLALLAGMRVAE